MKIGAPSVLAYVATITLLAVIPRPVAATPCMTAADQPTLVAACSGKSVGDPCASAGWVGSCQANPCGIADYDGQATPDILMCYLTSPDEADSGTSNEGGGFDATADTGTASDASTDAATEGSLQTGPDAADSGSTSVVRSSGGGCSCKTAGNSPGNAAAATLGLAIALSVTFGMRRVGTRTGLRRDLVIDVFLGRVTSSRGGRGLGRQPQVGKDATRRFALGNDGDHA